MSGKAMEIWTQPAWLVDYGYDALFFYDRNGICVTRYDENTARSYFGSNLKHAIFTGSNNTNTWQEIEDVALETFQVEFN